MVLGSLKRAFNRLRGAKKRVTVANHALEAAEENYKKVKKANNKPKNANNGAKTVPHKPRNNGVMKMVTIWDPNTGFQNVGVPINGSFENRYRYNRTKGPWGAYVLKN